MYCEDANDSAAEQKDVRRGSIPLGSPREHHQRGPLLFRSFRSLLSVVPLQRGLFVFARMSCSEQSAFHGQTADLVRFFSELLLKKDFDEILSEFRR